MELTATQLQHIDAMHTKAQKCLVLHQAWMTSRYKDYTLCREEDNLEGSVKNDFKAIITEWLEARHLTAFIRSELRIRYLNYPNYDGYKIQLGATSIFNGKGSLDSKSRWLNKITVTPNGPHGKVRIRGHAARTDPNYLEPTATEFADLIQAIVDTLDQ